MELTVLYELRDRLKAGAVAGTGLISEDFRLKRAIEAMAPLEKASPVFAKLGQAVGAVLATDCPDRAGALLDAISLADAVLCTQGAVAASEPISPLTLSGGGSVAANAPYSVLAPLVDALTSTGNGKYSFVLDMRRERPELFSDYRVKIAIVAALGAGYTELAQNVEDWLSEEDESILPLLEQGFDPRGKKEMVRRVHVMEAVAGGRANEFYLERLESSEKEVRAALIYALRHCETNAAKLLELIKTEKGNCKKTAQWALASLNTPEAWEYWESIAAKKPERAAEFMVYATSQRSGRLVGSALLEAIAPCAAEPGLSLTKEGIKRLPPLLHALVGKSGPEICEFYRRGAALGTALDRPAGGEKEGSGLKLSFYSGANEERPFSEMLPLLLGRSIVFQPEQDILELALELYEKYGDLYAPPAILAALLSRPAAEAYELAEPYFADKLLQTPDTKKKKKQVLLQVLNYMKYIPEEQRLGLCYRYWDPAVETRSRAKERPLAEPLDRRWYESLMRLGTFDGELARLILPEDRELCARLGEYFYHKALREKDSVRYLYWLRACGWTDCRGLLENYCRRQKQLTGWSIREYLVRLPGDSETRAAEAEKVLSLMESGEIHHNVNLDAMRELVADLKDGRLALL